MKKQNDFTPNILGKNSMHLNKPKNKKRLPLKKQNKKAIFLKSHQNY